MSNDKTPSAAWADQESAKEMQDFYKATATVKPGGCVQLGDGPNIEERARELLAAEYAMVGSTKRADKIIAGFDCSPGTEYALRAIVAALSAQPSPGGQGDALLREVCSQLESLDCGACIGSDAPMEDLHGRIAAHLAARQPVGEPVAWMHTHKATGQIKFGLSPMYDCDFNAAHWDSVALSIAPPAQAVGLGQFREAAYEAWRSAEAGSEAESKINRLLALIDGKAVGNG